MEFIVLRKLRGLEISRHGDRRGRTAKGQSHRYLQRILLKSAAEY